MLLWANLQIIMQTIKIRNNSPSERQLEEICKFIEEGKTVIIPTDTLYGIACDALNTKAINTICRIKGINPEKTNLSIICSDISMASEYARIDNYAFKLLKEETPGPITFLFKTVSSLPKAFKGRKTVGIRIPDNKICHDVVERLGHPIMTTSIEYQDDDYAKEPGLIAENYHNKIDVMIEGESGDTNPSAIIDCTGKEAIVIRKRD